MIYGIVEQHQQLTERQLEVFVFNENADSLGDKDRILELSLLWANKMLITCRQSMIRYVKNFHQSKIKHKIGSSFDFRLQAGSAVLQNLLLCVNIS